MQKRTSVVASSLRLLNEIIRYNKGGFFLTIALSLISNVLRGIGIVLIVPALSLFNKSGENSFGIVNNIKHLFETVGISLNLSNLLLIILLLVIVSSVLDYFSSIYVSKYQLGFKQHIRKKVFKHILNLSWEQIISFNKSEFIRLTDSEVNSVASSNALIFNIIINLMQIATYIGAAFIIDWKIPFILLFVAVLLFVLVYFFHKKNLLVGYEINEQRSHIYQVSLDNLSNLKYAKSQGLEQQLLANFLTSTDSENQQQQQRQKYNIGANTLIRIASAILLTTFIWVSINIYKLEFDKLLIFLLIGLKAMPLISRLQMSWQGILNNLPAFMAMRRFLENTRANYSIEQRDIGRLSTAIKLENVTIKRQSSDKIVLDNINVTIPAHQITVIVGHSGSGKTTLADAISGLILPQAGNIYIDETRLDISNLAAWSKKISYVPQEPILFSGTLRDNFSFGAKKLTDDEIWVSLKKASIDKMFKRSPVGLDTMLGPAGQHLSGGEKQRITLARALAHEHELLILDEPTSAQDYINEIKIREQLLQHKQHATILIIAHKKEIMRYADKIIMLERGVVLKKT